MLTENGNIVIPKKPAANAESYEWLRKAGLTYIEQFSGKVWTDYNLHDPGITILELLCYAITDLSYRSSFPVADLLTAEGAKGPDKQDFFTARKILTTHPVTLLDYKKLILDRIPGIRNVWFETLDNTNYEPAIYYDKKIFDTILDLPQAGHEYEQLALKGLYVVKLEVEDHETIKAQHPFFLKTLVHYRNAGSLITSPEAEESEYKDCLVNYTKKLLHESRNLCEDFEIVKVADTEYVAVCADIELQPAANADDVFLKINSVLFNYINPPLRFHSFAEMLAKGKTTEEIYNGPAMTRGFIDDAELERNGRKDVLYVSDIINLLMDIPGILQIKTIHLSSYKKMDDGGYKILKNAQSYCLHLIDPLHACFQFALDAGETDPTKIFNHIRFSKGLIYFAPKRKASYQHFQFIDYPDLPKDFQNDLPVPSGSNRKLRNYYSVQNDFPLCYYTGMDGIPNGETKLRKAQRLQSKAFLLFFDQVLADFLSQLDHLKKTFSIKGGVFSKGLEAFRLDSTMIRDLKLLLASDHKSNEAISDEVFFKKTYDDYQDILETPAQQKDRRSRLLDHLLARFNEVFVDYTVFKFQQNKEGDFFDQHADAETINDKIHFLKIYPVISSKRSHAFNYTKNVYATNNLSGLQLRIQKMLGLNSSQNKALVNPLNNIPYQTLLQNISAKKIPTDPDKILLEDDRFTAFDKHFGIHVLEHILLRPLYKQTPLPMKHLLPLCGDGTNNQHAECLLPDHYSMQMTVVAPGWLSISNNMDFRSFVENLVRMEAPAHVAMKICWLDPAVMYLFEKTTESFFNHMAIIKKPGALMAPADIKTFNEALQDVNTMMGLLKNMYLGAKLDECENINYNADTDKIHVPVILDHTALGDNGEGDWFVFKKTN